MAAFAHPIETEQQLRELVTDPLPRAWAKAIDHLDAHCVALIAASPYVLLGTAGAEGRCDVSPRGGPPGFVRVLDERRLAFGDLTGNRRADSWLNLLQSDGVGLLFLLPGRHDTLRVNGRGTLTTDPALLAQLEVRGRVPALALGVEVREAYLHCGKASIRSQLWDREQRPEGSELPRAAQVLHDHVDDGRTLDEVQDQIDESYATRLW